MPISRVKALVPTAVAAAVLLQEFPSATLETDGTLWTVVILGIAYPDAVNRIRRSITRSHIGPVLVTDDATAEELLDESNASRRRPLRRARRPGPA